MSFVASLCLILSYLRSRRKYLAPGFLSCIISYRIGYSVLSTIMLIQSFFISLFLGAFRRFDKRFFSKSGVPSFSSTVLSLLTSSNVFFCLTSFCLCVFSMASQSGISESDVKSESEVLSDQSVAFASVCFACSGSEIFADLSLGSFPIGLLNPSGIEFFLPATCVILKRNCCNSRIIRILRKLVVAMVLIAKQLIQSVRISNGCLDSIK